MSILNIILWVILLVSLGTVIVSVLRVGYVMGWSYLLNKIKTHDFWDVVKSFLQTRAERNVFMAYIGAMVTIAGVIPIAAASVVASISNDNLGDIVIALNFVVDNNDWIGAFLTIAYVVYAFVRYKQNIPSDIVESLSNINKQISFYPNRKWFECQANNAIIGLHNRYDKAHNVKNSRIDLILASLRRDLSLADLWIEDIEKILDNMLALSWKEDDKVASLVQPLIDEFTKIMNMPQWSNNDVMMFVETFDKLNEISRDWFEHLAYDDRNKNLYHWRQFESSIQQLFDSIHSPWIECLHKQVMLVTGAGGMGKSHMLGNIVENRIVQGDPTIFILGAWLSDSQDPWTQILGRLDVKCRKETFFENLNDYAIRSRRRIQIIVDAINESTSSRGREYWADNMTDFLSAVTPYANIGIVLSLRTTPFNGALDDFINDKSHATYEVTGFRDNLSVACEYMFDSYGLPLPYWSTFVGVFSNPMWLHIYCDAHAMLPQTIQQESHWQIVEHYLKGFNKQFAERFQYIESRQLLQKTLFAIAHKMILEQKFYSLGYDEVVNVISQTLGGQFQIDDFLKELLYADILQQETGLNGEVNIHFGFDSFGNYVTSYVLVHDFPETTWKNFGIFTTEIAEIVPLLKKVEYFTCLEPNSYYYNEAINAFIESLSFRSSITDSGKTWLHSIWSKEDYDAMFEIISYCVSNTSLPYNALTLYDLLFELSAMDRDALWTTRISQQSDIYEHFLSLSRWIVSSSFRTIKALSPDVAKLLCETFVWCLCSTNGVLRDTATKALTAILSQHCNLLDGMLRKYYAINDWYIVERIWGVAFGCCTRNQSVQLTTNIAHCAYELVFSKNPIIEHILVRDYARLIIEYAEHMGIDISDIGQSYLPPYNTYFSIPIPTDAYMVAVYENVYKNHPDKAIGGSAMAVINSMFPEYSRKGVGGYGDFGRYTFQASLGEFPEKPKDLSNWATKMIFEDFGYQPEKVKRFDTNVGAYGHKEWERIGKKYQWLSLYRVAAILSDLHVNDKPENSWFDSSLLATRNIDPTVLPLNHHSKLQLHLFKQPNYINPKIDDKEWIRNPKSLPKIEKMIVQKSSDNVEWIGLYMYNEYTLRNRKLAKDELNRNIWLFFQSCFIAKQNAKSACHTINKHGLQGRCFDENHEIYNLYAGEFFWSKVYKEQISDCQYEYRPFSIGHETIVKEYMMRPSMIEYTHEYVSDHSSEEGDTIYFPNPHIVSIMHLKQNDIRGIWFDELGDVAVYDNALVGKRHALVVRKDILLKYLQKTNQVVIWPILIEKRLKNWRTDHSYGNIKIKQCGGYAMMDAKGKFKHKIRQYESDPTHIQILFNKYIKTPFLYCYNQCRNLGVKIGFVKLSEQEILEMKMRQYLANNSNDLNTMLNAIEQDVEADRND